MKRLIKKFRTQTILAFIAGSLVITSCSITDAQQLEKFQTGTADLCFGDVQVYGYQTGPTSWFFNLEPAPNISGVYPSGSGYIEYTWTLADALGILSTGSFDSRVQNTSGGSPSGADFTTSRPPTGTLSQMTFSLTGYAYAVDYISPQGNPCGESLYAIINGKGVGDFTYQTN